MEHEGGLVARAFFVEDPDGYKIEVLQKHGRFQSILTAGRREFDNSTR